MSTKENTAVLNPSDASSEEQSSTSTTNQLALPGVISCLRSVYQRIFSCFPEKCKYRGLNNEGATCYLNATLQVLFMTESFRERVMGSSSDTNENLLAALKKIFQELSNQESGALSVSTSGIIASLGIQNVNEQQDAVEYFLDILEKVDPTLAEVFSGTLRNSRMCSENPKHVSYDYSPFKSLQIPVITRDRQFKLEDGLKKYFEPTILDEDDQMYCDECDEKRDTTLSIEIQKYPEILPLHLKRFEYDYRVCRFVKNDCPMDVPLNLSLQGQKYSLYAVINHTGNRSGGHCTAVIRSFTDDKWYHFNDSHVTKTDESNELKGSSEAYFLLYQKTSSDTDVEDMKEVPQMKPAEPGEEDRAECGGDNKQQLEVSAETERLMNLVLSSSETESLKVELSKVSPESQPWHGETIRDYICSPGPHMVLWVDPVKFKKKDFIQILFEESYRFLSNNSSNYIMIVFTSKIRPKKMLIKIAMQNYASIENNQVLDAGTDMFVVQIEYVTKLPKTVNYELERKPKKRNHEKTEAAHEKRASKKKMSSNQENREKST